ncbi:hypothetical protein HK096_005631, partial [Nowakowskiella sp. JEL0078]
KNSDFQKGYRMCIFVQNRNKSTELWDGPRAGLDAAKWHWGADESCSIKDLQNNLKNYLMKSPQATIFTDLPISKFADIDNLPTILNLIVEKLENKIASLRLVKSDAESKVLRHVGKISGRAFAETMKFSSKILREKKMNGSTNQLNTITEHQIHATIEYSMKMNGANGLAYVPVIAGGENGLIIHYVLNSQVLDDKKMVLVDAGAHYHGYVSDITRTWPISGKFTKPQKEIYEIVLNAQRELIKKCTAKNNISLNELMIYSQDHMRSGLEKLFKRSVSNEEMRVLYPHHVGHYMGLDVHDTECISNSIGLKKGFVVTIEPGLYIPLESKFDYPEEYKGIAVRIEDDVLIGESYPTVLTAEAPKEIDDIEAVMSGLLG